MSKRSWINEAIRVLAFRNNVFLHESKPDHFVQKVGYEVQKYATSVDEFGGKLFAGH